MTFLLLDLEYEDECCTTRREAVIFGIVEREKGVARRVFLSASSVSMTPTFMVVPIPILFQTSKLDKLCC